MSYLNNLSSNFKFLNLSYYLKTRLNLKNKKNIKSIEAQNKNFLQFGSIIYGAGYAGKAILKELKKRNEDIIFFVDDNKLKQNTNICGIPVISYENLLRLKNNINVKKIYLSIPSLKKEKLNFLLKKIKNNFFDVRFLPEKKFLISDKININDLNLNEINNILQRKQIKVKKINNLSKSTVLVTGAAGTIGSEICRQLKAQNASKIVALDSSELGIYKLKKVLGNEINEYILADINDKIFLQAILKKHKFNLIIHAAAYKHVNILEKNIFPAVKNNIFATKALCELARSLKINLLFISTDKAANPKSILGITKRVAEKICINFGNISDGKNWIRIVRFGNVFGSSGSAIENFLDQINNLNAVTITDKKATRYFMTIQEACHLVLQTTSFSKMKNNMFILNMGKPINVYQLAKDLGKIKSNLDPYYKFNFIETGLKPGEKLYENLVDKTENISCYNNDIMTVEYSKFNTKKFKLLFNKLECYYSTFNKNSLTQILKKLVK